MYRVWWIRNIPFSTVYEGKYYSVNTVEEAVQMLMSLAEIDSRDKRIYSNAGGLEVLKDKWEEWCCKGCNESIQNCICVSAQLLRENFALEHYKHVGLDKNKFERMVF